MSESEIALITQVVVSTATINVNVAVNDEATVDGCVPRQDTAHPATYVAIEADDTQRTGSRHPGKAQQSPFVAGFGLCEFGSVSIKCVKGRSLPMPRITFPLDYGFIQAFSSFVDEGMITKMGSVAVYSDDNDYLELSYDFEVSSFSRKTWFHTLNYLGRPISYDDIFRSVCEGLVVVIDTMKVYAYTVMASLRILGMYL
ncbi:hypothetical protein HAX54_004296 [Datura stramonium]|uniref:Uncharacterized protein n=1 Tax=Datura stramonium TaxID=4076 RepID=A0ABS8WST2_DATST|nr:hypothetical protein [Datura stramonium]